MEKDLFLIYFRGFELAWGSSLCSGSVFCFDLSAHRVLERAVWVPSFAALLLPLCFHTQGSLTKKRHCEGNVKTPTLHKVKLKNIMSASVMDGNG